MNQEKKWTESNSMIKDFPSKLYSKVVMTNLGKLKLGGIVKILNTLASQSNIITKKITREEKMQK